MSIQSDIQKLAPGTLVDLFTLDARPIGGEIFYFHSGLNELQADVVWQGQSYARYPIEAEGFELRANGTSPRPRIRASNYLGLLGAASSASDDLVGAKITRKRTFARYLDHDNFPYDPSHPEHPEGYNSFADPNVHFDDEIYFVDRKISENLVIIEWELVSAMDLAGVKLPKRQIIANVCAWRYRGPECNYTGGACAEGNGVATSDLVKDACGKRLSDCRLRFGNGVLRFGGFPAAGLIK